MTNQCSTFQHESSLIKPEKSLLLLVFQDKINKLFAATEQQVESNQLSELIAEQEITTVIVEPELEPELDIEEQGRLELEQLVAELTAIEEQAPVIEVASQPQQEIAKPITIEVAPQAINTPLYHQQQWVLQQDSNAYTFQLMGSWDQQKVIAFINKHTLMGDVAIFNSKRSGRIWYAAIYGVFESKEVALQASALWPAPLNTLPKWLRPFDSVQQQVQK